MTSSNSTSTRTATCLSQSDEYAMRAMALIALRPTGEVVSGPAIAEATGIPPHYLSKILRRLVVAGLLHSTRGRSGGFQLALPPDTIRFLDILMATDFRPDATRCVFGWPACNPKKPCPLHPTYEKLNKLFLTWAARTTLADIVEVGEDVLIEQANAM